MSASDPGDTLTLGAAGLPAGASFNDNGDGTGAFSWTPAVGDRTASPYAVTFSATDSLGQSAEETIEITVTAQSVGGALTGSVVVASPTVDLTGVGALDWVHWGRINATDVDRKKDVVPQISNYTTLNGANASTTTQVASTYTWSDGTPALNGTTKTGLRLFNVGKGFELTVPADTTPRNLTVYVGATAARGRLEAFLSDGSAPDYDTLVDQPSGSTSRAITLSYQAGSAGQSLTLRYFVDAIYLSNYKSWITLESAALAGQAGELTLPYFLDFSAGTAPDWQVVNESGTPSSWNVTNEEYRQDNFVGFLGNAMQGGYHLGTFTYLATGMHLENYAFSVTAIPLADSGQDIGVMIRTDPSTGDYIRFSFSAANGFARLERRYARIWCISGD